MIKGHSEKWKLLQAEHLERVRVELTGRAAHFMRGRLAHAGYSSKSSTSSSSWSIDAKQRQLEEAEELRRRAILTIRKAELRDATERFQRATSPLRSRRPSSPHRQRPSSAPSPRSHNQAMAPSIPAAAVATPATSPFIVSQPVISGWVPAAASTDGKASAAFTRKYGSFHVEQPDAASVGSHAADLQMLAEPASEQRAHVAGMSAAAKQQHRQNAVWASLSAPKEAADHSHAVGIAVGSGPSWRPAHGTGSTIDATVPPPPPQPRFPMRPSSAGAVMMNGTWAASNVAGSGFGEQLGMGGRQAVAIPQVSTELADGALQHEWEGGATDRLASSAASAARAAASDEWLSAEPKPLPSGQGRLHAFRSSRSSSSASKQAWTAAVAVDDARLLPPTAAAVHVAVPPGPAAGAASAPVQATLAPRTSAAAPSGPNAVAGPSSPAIAADAAAAATRDADSFVHARGTKPMYVSASESASSTPSPDRGYRDSASSVHPAGSAPAPDLGGSYTPVPPPGRPAERFQRRPMSADFARRGSSSAAVASTAASAATPAVAATPLSSNAPGSGTAAAPTASVADQPGTDMSHADMFYIKSRTDSKPKETAAGPAGVGAGPAQPAAGVAVSTPSRAQTDEAHAPSDSAARVVVAPRLEPTSATTAAPPLHSRAPAGGSLSAAVAPTGVASCARPGSGTRTVVGSLTTTSADAAASSASSSSLRAVALLTSSSGSWEAESDSKQPRSILKRPSSGHSVASSAASNGNHFATEEWLASHRHASSLTAEAFIGKHDGGARRKSVRFSDDDSQQLVGSTPAMDEDMNGRCGGASTMVAHSPDSPAWQHGFDAASLLQFQLRASMTARMPAPMNSPVDDDDNDVGDAMLTEALGGASSTSSASEALLKREQQPKRVLPAATPIVSHNEQQQQRWLLTFTQPGAAEQTRSSQIPAQALPVPGTAATSVVTIPALSPSRAAMPTMSAYLPAEEQRLLNALEVLNRRLKISDDLAATDAVTDASITRAAAYRGHLPWSSSQSGGSNTRLEDPP